MAGAVAALAAATRGRSVTLLRKAPGATALASGAIDLAPMGEQRHVTSVAVASATAGWLEAVASRSPSHPYCAVGPRGLALIGDAADMILGRLADAGLPHAPFDAKGRGHLVVDLTGKVRRVASAQASQKLEETEPGKRRIGVVRFRRHLSLDTGLTLAGLRAVFANVVPVEVDWPDEADGAFLLPVEIGRRLDDPRGRSALFKLLRTAVAGKRLTHLVLPPIAGLEHVSEVMRAVSDVTGTKAVETLGGEASLPGHRLDRALSRALEAAGVRLETNAHGASDGKLKRFPGAIVLASGRFIGGGLERRDRLRETIFDLPVDDGARPIKDEPLDVLTSRRGLGAHRVFRAGIRIDENLRPLDVGGKPFREGLFAAGSVIGGHDPQADFSGMGVAILTGYLAGLRAAEWKRS